MRKFLLYVVMVSLICAGCVQDDAPVPVSDPTTPTQVQRTFAPDNSAFLNPERGIYANVDLLDTADNYASVRVQKSTLAYVGVSLGQFRHSPLSQDFLGKLESGFQRVRKADIKVILRFNYNVGSDLGDAPLERITGHISQLAPILQKNADVISVVQAGFIGAWGEWHASTNNLDTPVARAAVLDAWLKLLPADRTIQIRTPMYKAEYLASDISLNDTQAFSGIPAARIAHHNDCFLSSENDEGTYAIPVSKWENYVAQEGRFLPIGGETCRVNPPRTNCAIATAEMEKFHWSFLNSFHHVGVIAEWRKQGCFEEIGKRLGYRIQLLEANWSPSVKPGAILRATIKLQNNGYAAMYNPRPVYLVLQNASFRYVFDTGVDPRRWEAGAVITKNLEIKMDASMAPGAYDIYLWLPDADVKLRDRAQYAVRLANADVWQAVTGMNLLSGQGAILSVDP